MGAVPEELQLLAGLNHGVVTVLCEDGVSQDTVVVVPSMFRHAAGLPTAFGEVSQRPAGGSDRLSAGLT